MSLDNFDKLEKNRKAKGYREGEMGINNPGVLYIPYWFCKDIDLPPTCDIHIDLGAKRIAIEFNEGGEYKVTTIGRTGNISIRKALTILGRYENRPDKVAVTYDPEEEILYLNLEEELDG